jgi:hypothetical protein
MSTFIVNDVEYANVNDIPFIIKKKYIINEINKLNKKKRINICQLIDSNVEGVLNYNVEGVHVKASSLPIQIINTIFTTIYNTNNNHIKSPNVKLE